MLLPLIIVGGAVVASFGAVKAAAVVVFGGGVVIREVKNRRAQKIDLNPGYAEFKRAQNEELVKAGLPMMVEEQDLHYLVIDSGAVPGHEDISGEWLLTEEELERLNGVLEKLEQGIVPADLERLQWPRKARLDDAIHQPFLAARRAELQKPRG